MIAQKWAEPHAHCAFEATPTLLVIVVTSLVSCRLRAPPPAPPADSRLAGSREKLDGLRKKGVVTMLGAGFPTLLLANSRLVFPSMEVRGRAPPDARAWMVASRLLFISAGLRLSSAPPYISCDADMIVGSKPVKAVRLAPPSPVPVTSSCPAPCMAVVAMETATSCLTAVVDGVREGDVMTGVDVVTVGAMEMMEGVFDIT